MLPKLAPIVILVSLVAGCTAAPVVTVDIPITASGDVRLVRNSTTFTVQALRIPYELNRLSRIKVFVTDVTGATAEQSLGDLPHTGTGDTDHVFDAIVLKSLKRRRDYTVRLEAYMVDPALGPDEVRVDKNDAHESETLFSTSTALAGSLGSEDQLNVDTLKGGFALTLKNQAFSGTATGGVAITNGILDHTGAESASNQELN